MDVVQQRRAKGQQRAHNGRRAVLLTHQTHFANFFVAYLFQIIRINHSR